MTFIVVGVGIVLAAGSRCNRQESLRLDLAAGDVDAIEKTLKSHPTLASRKFRFGDTPLHWAVVCERPKEMIDLLVANGADINAKESDFGLTPLHKAAWNGKTEAVKALLAHKADVNAFNERNLTPLNYAVTAGSKEIIELLLAAGADINRGYSVLSSAEGSPQMIPFLLSKGATSNVKDLNGDTPLHRAIRFDDVGRITALLASHPDLRAENNEGLTPLSQALEKGRRDMVTAILDYAVTRTSNNIHLTAARSTSDELRSALQTNAHLVGERDEIGFTPLHWASQSGNLAAVRLLIASGANLNAADASGHRPLDWAAVMGWLEVVKFLIANGASADLQTKRFDAPLLFAVQQGHLAVARFLLEQGAEVNARQRYGRRPLHIAANKGDLPAVRLLLEFNAPINETEINRSTPLVFAVMGRSKEIVDLLLTNGASVSIGRSGMMTLLHEWALGAGDPGIADSLLAQGLVVDFQDSDGKTALHWAVHQGQIPAVKWLLEHGANVNAKDRGGLTPLDLLKNRRGGVRREEVAGILRSHGAR